MKARQYGGGRKEGKEVEGGGRKEYMEGAGVNNRRRRKLQRKENGEREGGMQGEGDFRSRAKQQE